VKFELFASDGLISLVEGEVERIGQPDANLWLKTHAGDAGQREEHRVIAANHGEALADVLDALGALEVFSAGSDLAVVGHRVVHGGDRFDGPVLIDDTVREGIEALALLAPLHTSANLAGMEAARECLPDVPQVAVFDTVYHRTMPQRARDYALPRGIARAYGIHRYGFHGISHEYVARRAAVMLGEQPGSLDLITLHLGAGASVTAVHAGMSIDTSMGMTPLEGLVMGTRSGDVDPAVPMLLGEITGRTREEVHHLLNHESGLKGLCGTGDMREVHRLADAGDADAVAALDLYCYRAKKYVGAYAAALGRLDALVFTAGVGENDASVREQVCEGLGLLGIEIDVEKNRAPGREERFVSSEGSAVAVLVVPTDEEREIARLAYECVREEGRATEEERHE
jgi:acetate kinase